MVSMTGPVSISHHIRSYQYPSPYYKKYCGYCLHLQKTRKKENLAACRLAELPTLNNISSTLDTRGLRNQLDTLVHSLCVTPF